MSQKHLQLPLYLWLSSCLALATCAGSRAVAAEFAGPFPSWENVKTQFGAVGDGKADDTAAIQRALDDLQLHKTSSVLYFPSGTYRITGTVSLLRGGDKNGEAHGVSIVGQDPVSTIIKWDGPAGGNMCLYNPWYSGMSRFTFDGSGTAETAIQHGPHFSTGNEFTDMVFKDVQFGIKTAPQTEFGNAETAVLRCRFYHCAQAGISIENFNALDWWIWGDWFEDCGAGVTNQYGAGNFHVYRSTFLRSTDADITLRHAENFSIFGNVSVGSHQFFHAMRAHNWKDTETWGSQVVLQDNLILDPTDPTPIVIENNGPNLLLDNSIRLQGNGPVVLNTPPSDQSDLIAVGNRWTVGGIQVKGRLTDLDNTVVPAAAIATPTLAPVPFAPAFTGPVIEVPPDADGSVIQAAINQAVATKGLETVIHLPKGIYPVSNTIVIPAGSDLQIVGDGVGYNTTRLQGAGADPVFRVEGPTHASFRNFDVEGGRGIGIEVDNCDQAGSRVFGEQLCAMGSEYGIVTDGIQRAEVEFHGCEHDGLQDVGAGAGTLPWTRIFGGTGGRQHSAKPGFPLYDVENEGRLFVRDVWCEGESWRMFNLTGSGDFDYTSGRISVDTDPKMKTIDWERDLRAGAPPENFDGFRGRVAITLVGVNNGKFNIVSPAPDLKLLLLGVAFPRQVQLTADDFQGQLAADHIKQSTSNGLVAVSGTGEATPAFLREMLTPLRTVKPDTDDNLAADVTDVRFYRVWCYGKNGLRVQASPGP